MARARAELFGDGLDEERLARLTELFEKYMDADDPQMQDGMRAGLGEIKLALGRLEDALPLVIDKEEMISSYPAGAEVGVLAAAQLRDESTLESLVSRLEKRHSRGRASRGLGLVSSSYLAALRDETVTAEKEFIEAEDLWAKTNSPLALAYARAVLAIVLGPTTSSAPPRQRRRGRSSRTTGSDSIST